MIIQAASSDYINDTTIGVFGVASASVFAVSVVFRKVFNINHPIVPFVIALLISFGLAASKETHTFMTWLIAFLNSCLLFCAATGINETAADLATKKPAGKGKQREGAGPMPWLKSFFH